MHNSWFLAVGASFLCTEVTYGKGSLLTERNLDMSTKTTFKFIFIMVVVYNKRNN